MGGADAGGRLDGQALVLLGDFHRWAGGRSHCDLPQEHIHTCSHTNRADIKLAAEVTASPVLVFDEWNVYKEQNQSLGNPSKSIFQHLF